MSDAVIEKLVEEVVALRLRVRALETLESRRGITDHGALSGLGDDDHPQYQLATRTAEGARVYHSAAISVPTSASTALPFNSERWDHNNCHDNAINNNRLTCNTTGWYIITGHISFSFNAAGQRQVQIMLGGSTTLAVHAQNANSAGGTHMSVACLYYLSAGQYVTLNVWQNSGVTLTIDRGANYSPEFAMVRIA